MADSSPPQLSIVTSRVIPCTYMILVSYSLVTASKRDNEQDLWLSSYMIMAMYSLVAASKRDWELVPP